MNSLERRLVQAFLETAPWQECEGREMATVWMEPAAISPECFPASVGVHSVLWHHTAPSGLVPVRIVKR